MEYESIADPNRCLLPADLLTPARCDRVAFERDNLAVSSANHGPVGRNQPPYTIGDVTCLAQ